MTLVLQYIARSDRGLVRANNEDSVYAGARLLALADGMGGHAAGEVASQLVIQAMRSLDDDEPGGDLLDKLGRAVRNGNAAIAEQVQQDPELDGMGTTLTAILFAGSRLGLCHIGDSRGYLFRDGALTQITRDDTFVQTLVDEGRITPEQAHSHPQRSLIMRALTGQEVEPTLIIREARAGDRYVLCSDGLSDVVSEATLADTIGGIEDHRECADRLVDLALRGGGPDNVTVIVADVVDTEYGESRPIVGGAAGDEEDYTPDPKTAAGRAAALRPPAASPKRPSIITDAQTQRPKSPWRRWLMLLGVLLIVAAIVVGFLVTRAAFNNSHYVGEDDGQVIIYQGSPDRVLFMDLSTGHKRACVTGLDQEKPEIAFVDYATEGTNCTPLEISDLQGIDRTTVVNNSIRNLPLGEAELRVQGLSFLPLCAAPAPDPAPAPSDVPPGDTPAPASGTPESPAPQTDAPQTDAPQTDAPQTDEPGAPVQTRYDADGNKLCRGGQ